MDNAHPPEVVDDLFRALCWVKGDLTWKLHVTQRLIHDAIEELPPDVKDAVLLCCRRFGKSFYGVDRSVMKCLSQPRRIQRIVGPEIKQTKMIVEHNMAKLCEELPRLGLRGLVEPVKSDNMYRVKNPAGESGIFLGGYDSQEDNLRGGEADEILIEETGASDPEQFSYQMKDVLKPQLLKTRGKMIHLTTLPTVPDHPFITETIPQAQLDGSYHSYTIYDDPLATPEIIADAVKDCGGEHTDTFRREYKNEMVRDPSRMAVPVYDGEYLWKGFTIPLNAPLMVSGDFGGVRDLHAFHVLCHDYHADLDLFLDELWFPINTPTPIIIAKLKLWKLTHHPKHWYIDAAGQTLIDLGAGGIEAILPSKVDWQSNVRNLASRIQQNKVRISAKCKLLAVSVRSGMLNEHRTDFERTEALGHLDAIASAMYGVRHLDRTCPDKPTLYSADTTFMRPTAHAAPQGRSLVGRGFGRFRR